MKLIAKFVFDHKKYDPFMRGNKLFSNVQVIENKRLLEVRYGSKGAGNSYTEKSYFCEKNEKEKVLDLLKSAGDDLQKFYKVMHIIENWNDDGSSGKSNYFAPALENIEG